LVLTNGRTSIGGFFGFGKSILQLAAIANRRLHELFTRDPECKPNIILADRFSSDVLAAAMRVNGLTRDSKKAADIRDRDLNSNEGSPRPERRVTLPAEKRKSFLPGYQQRAIVQPIQEGQSVNEDRPKIGR
jgi:hypothetical protein